MEIFSEIEITWDNETYRVKPTLALIQKIESRGEGFSIGKMYYRQMQGDFPISILAECYQIILSFAGVKVEPEEVYQAFYEKGADYISKAADAFFLACFPQQKEKKTTVKKK